MTPAARFAAFRKACLKWQQQLGLQDWRLMFELDRKAEADRHARVLYNIENRAAKVIYCARSETDQSIERLALHEMLHLLVAEALVLAGTRGDDTHADVIREEHRVIERLLKVLLP